MYARRGALENVSMSHFASIVALAAGLAMSSAALADGPIKALLITGHNNHNWQYTSRLHEETLEDLDGNRFHDLTGSYGVNVLGVDAYKACIEEAVAEASALYQARPYMDEAQFRTLLRAGRPVAAAGAGSGAKGEAAAVAPSCASAGRPRGCKQRGSERGAAGS